MKATTELAVHERLCKTHKYGRSLTFRS